MKLSIVSVTLNNINGLKKTATSILQQSWKDFEWLIIDGGSTDGTQHYLSSLEDKSTWWISEHDTGIYSAMNKGIARASGDYLIFMNAGDTFHSIQTLSDVFSRTLDSDVTYGDWLRVYTDTTELCKAPSPLPPYYFFWKNICQQAMFVKTKILKESGFDERYKVVGDWAKWRNLMLEGKSFGHIPIVICDFEAGIGISETHTEFADNEYGQLTKDFPIGLTIQGNALRDLYESADAFHLINERPLFKLLISTYKRFTIWKEQGFFKTLKNFFITLCHIVK